MRWTFIISSFPFSVFRVVNVYEFSRGFSPIENKKIKELRFLCFHLVVKNSAASALLRRLRGEATLVGQKTSPSTSQKSFFCSDPLGNTRWRYFACAIYQSVAQPNCLAINKAPSISLEGRSWPPHYCPWWRLCDPYWPIYGLALLT